jgi:tetratricopeptide (TPR) repeat protein
MSIQYMWGNQQQYGPFSAGEDGYPCGGEVVRHYRVLKRFSATQFAEAYGRALGEKAKTRIWVLTMERTNNVPTDITRRRAIADLLGIPYVLLGLSETLVRTPLAVDIPEPEKVEAVLRVAKRETVIATMLTEHEQVLTSYFNGFYHRHGHAALTEVTEATEEISLRLPHTRGHLQQRGITLIARYHQFGNNVAREQQRHDLAIFHADKAIEHAEEVQKIKPASDLMALVSYRRGITSFEQEITRINQPSDYRDAVSYIDAALSHAQSAIPLVNDFISLEWGLIHAHVVTSEKEKRAVRERLQGSYGYADLKMSRDDENYLRNSPSWYHLTYAEALIALGDYTEAIGELDVAEELTPLNQPRRFAYIDALRAMASLGLGEFKEAVSYARDALIESKAIKSEYNIARIAQVYRQLRERYKHSGDLTELGRELAKTHSHLV